MDFFKFTSSIWGATHLENGQPIQNLTSSSWIERYRNPSEFKFEAPISSGILEFLPLGTYISHVDTLEVMVVENHGVSELNNQNAVISGRSLETILEQRVVGSELVRTDPPAIELTEYYLTSTTSHVQATQLIEQHIDAAYLLDPDNALPGFAPSYIIIDLSAPADYDGVLGSWTVDVPPGFTLATSEARVFKRSTVYDALMELLSVDDYGVRVVRPGNWTIGSSYSIFRPGDFPGPWTASVFGPITVFVIHNGRNRAHEVIFSYNAGDIENADYLWTSKNKKTHAIVSGKWVEVKVTNDAGQIKDSRRIVHVDASFLDQDFNVPPTGPDLVNITAYMEALGNSYLATAKDVALIDVQISDQTKHVYRRDYNIGDLVRVDGNYDTRSLARVVEFVEIEDETGESSYPTLSLIDIPDS